MMLMIKKIELFFSFFFFLVKIYSIYPICVYVFYASLFIIENKGKNSISISSCLFLWIYRRIHRFV